MAITLKRATNVRNLTVTSTASFAPSDYVYQTGSPNAEGVVMKVINTTNMIVAEFYGTFVNGTINVPSTYIMTVSPASAFLVGQKITGQTSGAWVMVLKAISTTQFITTKPTGTFTDGEVLVNNIGETLDCSAGYPSFATSGSTTISGVAASADAQCNNNVCLVFGSDPTQTQIFRAIATHMTTTYGVTEPYSGNQYIQLNMRIYIGWKAQTELTEVLSHNEMVSFASNNSGICIVGIEGSFESRLKLGNPTYISGGYYSDYTDFPPLHAEDGTKMQLWGAGAFQNASLSVYTGGVLNINDSYITRNPSATYPQINVVGTLMMFLSTTEHLGNIIINFAANTKFWNCQSINSNYVGVILKSPDLIGKFTDFNTVTVPFYYYNVGAEVVISGYASLNNDGSLRADVASQYLGSASIHFVDSYISEDGGAPGGSGYIELLNERSFSIRVKDAEGNPIDDVYIDITDKDGYPATWLKIAGRILSVSGNEFTLTTTAGLSAGDVIMVCRTKLYINSVDSATKITATTTENSQSSAVDDKIVVKRYRAKTVNGYFIFNSWDTFPPIKYSQQYADADAVINEFNILYPFTVKLSKIGYQTKVITGINPSKDGMDIRSETSPLFINATLLHDVSAGRGNMGGSIF